MFDMLRLALRAQSRSRQFESRPICSRALPLARELQKWRGLKRRTLRKFSSATAKDHHHVYVVLLDSALAKLRKVRLLNPRRDSKKPCVYVGLTGLTPEERFVNHRAGVKSSMFVKRYGIRLLPELYTHLNPMPYEAAAQMEKDLTEDLRRLGYTVVGGH